MGGGGGKGVGSNPFYPKKYNKGGLYGKKLETARQKNKKKKKLKEIKKKKAGGGGGGGGGKMVWS